jgi:hypothetical protein
MIFPRHRETVRASTGPNSLGLLSHLFRVAVFRVGSSRAAGSREVLLWALSRIIIFVFTRSGLDKLVDDSGWPAPSRSDGIPSGFACCVELTLPRLAASTWRRIVERIFSD